MCVCAVNVRSSTSKRGLRSEKMSRGTVMNNGRHEEKEGGTKREACAVLIYMYRYGVACVLRGEHVSRCGRKWEKRKERLVFMRANLRADKEANTILSRSLSVCVYMCLYV